MVQPYRIVLWILVLVSVMTAYAQQSFVIRGKVVDAVEKENSGLLYTIFLLLWL